MVRQKLRYVPVEVSISATQERELFAEFQPLLYMAAAILVNVAKKQDFTRFAFLARALDLVFDEAHNSMIWPD
jgi:hypothetical protein